MSSLQDMVGVSSQPVKNEVEKGAIRKFAEAIGDDDPVYRDEEAAKKAGFPAIPVPPTFSRTFDYGEIPGLEMPKAGLIHGEQRFTYHKPIYAGDVVFCSRKLLKVRESSGRLGSMTFYMFEAEVRNSAGELLLVENSTVIRTGGAK
ncbi:MaoC family dehydratase N-terminal domain-containing protein [Alicyclobacillus tolerans]|uniref:Acyl dehydratase n=2 Tax=Alicyclobacillus tolerans TaxID=90970 RepID=A0A1M6T0D4_9BACL|nr:MULTISPECIES: MaoC family dehydratase N-terminal domain-containing protein [Alicyclobacillus]MDP9727864.1 acyl dehydratase [Alicyclobacillus tengchongensis]SHK50370.1 Acyl dehydratase [Alicyclobacillus montanus]